MDTFGKDLRKQTYIGKSTPSPQMQARKMRRLQFKEYLLKTGVQYELAKSLRMLFEEPVKPRNPIDFIVKHIGRPRMSITEYRKLHELLQVYLQKIAELKEEVEWFNAETSKVSLGFSSRNLSTSYLCPSTSEA